MKNFLRIAAGCDVMPIMMAIQRQPELFNQNTLRTTHPGTPHTQVSDIWLRFNELPEPGQEAKILDEHESVWYPAIYALPQCRPMIYQLMARVDGERLGRCLITKLEPGKKIAPHVDGGSHAAYYERFHVVLQGYPGSQFRCGNESVDMLTGEIWWFNNAIEHEVINNSADDRLHLIVDIRTAQVGGK